LIAFSDFPGLDVGQCTEGLGGLHHTSAASPMPSARRGLMGGLILGWYD